MRRRFLSLLLALAAAAAPVAVGRPVAAAGSADGCDPVDPAACLLPFPSDYHTVADVGTDTGIRVNFARDAMPANVFGTHINPWEWNRNDGFSPGSALLTHVPGIDPARTGVAPQTDIARSLDPDAPIVLVNTKTGARHPYWAELDSNATGARQALIIRPARSFDEGTRYAVGLRRLRDGAGTLIAPNPAWTAVSGPDAPTDAGLTRRWQYARRAVGALAAAGVAVDDLYLAWDFTIASRRNLTERMLHMRDEAFGNLSVFSPVFTVTSNTVFTAEENPRIQRRIEGQVFVPSYLNNTLGPPGSWLNYGDDGLPDQLNVNTQVARYICNIPRNASPANPARPALYGHGLLGDPAEITSPGLEQYANESNTMMCATPWIGMASEDVPNVLVALADFSQFPSIPDRSQQGFLNFLFLGRAMIHSWAGFAANGSFRAGGKALVRSGRGQLVYLGNSQGGILGGALTAVAQDFTRAMLGVPAMNYSLLLNRSTDFDQFQTVFGAAYPDRLDQQIILGLAQMVWDRGEANGYAAHMTTDPLPNTPAHRVLLIEAFGDHQVANVATEVEARSVPGVRLREPALAPGRSLDREPFWGIARQTSFPYAGSALVVVDSGQPAPPPANTPPRQGQDPHGHPGNSPQIRAMVAHFLATGQVTDTCAGAPCTAPAD
jgi:hypothetical protein